MAAASPAPAPSAADGAADSAASGLDRFINRVLGLAKSWVGLLTAYVVGVTAAVVAFQKFSEPLNGSSRWILLTLLAAPLVVALVFQAIPELIDRRRRKRLTEITGHLQAGYFQLAPREDEASFARADGKHEEILRWLEQRSAPILYLTGLSGSGKSSLLAAWVLPRLERAGTVVIRLRGYQDPVAVLEQELLRPGVIWQKPTAEAGDIKLLLERACRYLGSRRLLVVLDQFEEFVILQDPDKQKRFEQLISALREQLIAGLTFLFVFRNEYTGLIEKLALPPLNQNTNWQEVPPFTESAARDFVQASGLQVGDDVLRNVLREAAEIEQTKGIIRPVTINLCGLVLGRFAIGLPRGFRPGGLIRGFLRESVLLPQIRDIAPVLLPHLITGYVTKRPRTVSELAADLSSDQEAVRGCLRVLGQSDRAIVRPLDTEQQTWEISHDFLVPLLDSIVGRWRAPFWRRLRSWLPWIAATAMVVAVLVAANGRRDLILELEDLGWKVQKTNKALELQFDGVPPPQSLKVLQRTSQPLHVSLNNFDDLSSISGWSVVKNLTTLELRMSKVSDLAPLRELTSLTELHVAGMPVSDVSPLKELRSLTTLDLGGTRVRDVSPLNELTNLTSLNLGGTQVSDVSPLKGLKNLTSLDLGGTDVSDVSSLKGLTNLTTLYLTNTNVGEVSSLKELTNLTTLNLSDTKVTDVSPLKELTNLTTLNLYGTNMADVLPLRGLTNLTTLHLSNSEVSDLSPLKALTNLTTLDFSDTKVSNVSSLEGLKKLSTLHLSGTKVADVSPLKGLMNLTTLNLYGTRVSDVSPLKGLMNLKQLNLGRTRVSDLSPLKDLMNLTELYLINAPVSDVSPLKGLTKLTVLNLQGTQVTDVSSLKKIRNLHLYGSQL